MCEALTLVFDRSHPYQWEEPTPHVLRSPLVGEHEVTIDGCGLFGGWRPQVILWTNGQRMEAHRAKPWSQEARFFRWRRADLERQRVFNARMRWKRWLRL
jgi:hypothetical protein